MFNCGSTVIDACKGKSIKSIDPGLQRMVGELVNSLTFLITIFAQVAAESMSLNMMKAVNALRCALLGFGENGWNFIAALWFLLKQFKKQAWLKKQIDKYYPYVCTCKKEADKIAKTMGATNLSTEVFNACSEAANDSSQEVTADDNAEDLADS